MLDKLAHFLEYALFAWLTYRSISNISLTRSPTIAAAISLIALVGFAALDEYYQQYVPGRHSDSMDILSDSIGATVVLALLWLRSRRSAARDQSHAQN
jgi:VanZ family protein